MVEKDREIEGDRLTQRYHAYGVTSGMTVVEVFTSTPPYCLSSESPCLRVTASSGLHGIVVPFKDRSTISINHLINFHGSTNRIAYDDSLGCRKFTHTNNGGNSFG